MNKFNRKFRMELPACPKCGMDSGRRVVTDIDDVAMERYFVICDACGFRTKPRASQAAATHDWCAKG